MAATAELTRKARPKNMSLSPKALQQEECDDLVAQFNSGRYLELEERTRLLVEEFPDSGMVWKALGASIQMQGREEEALPALQRAAELLPDDAPAQSNLGRALRRLGQLDVAMARFRRAVEIKPDFADAHNNLGAVLQDLGQLKEAVASYRRAVQIKPDSAVAHNNLGTTLQKLGLSADAAASFRRALEINPDFAEAHSNLGGALLDLGHLADAAACYRRAIEINPDFVQAHNRLGVTLRRLGQPEAAAASHRRALEIDPDHASAHNNLGIALRDIGQLDAAMTSYRRALEIEPDFAPAHINLGGALEDLWRLDDAVASFRRALQIDPESTDVRSSLLSLQQYLPDIPAECLLAEARQFGDLVARQANIYNKWANIREPERCLRVGLVSPDFRSHPVGFFLEDILAALALHAAGRLEIIGYTTNTHTDEVTERIKACCHAWHTPMGVSDEALARQLRDDGIDILIDLSGHTVHNRLPLFAWKPAPVQVSWLGYFATTGLAAMDYLIADPWTLPEAEEVNFTEKIWRLPETRLCFTAPDVDIQVTPLPAFSNGYIVFGCFQNPNKINDALVAMWARVMQAVPGSRLLLKAKLFDEARVRQSILDRFAANGIDAGRLLFEGFSSRAEYLATYQRVDMVLDSFPFPGGTTTVESLWMGVPVLTLGGTSFLARQGVGFLMNAGLPDWIAADADDYLARAVAHAGDLPRLAALRKGLRQQVLTSPIFDAPRFAGHFEAALRGMWRTWCSTQHLPAHCQPLPQAEIDQLVGMFNAGRHAELEERTRFLIDQDPDLGIAWKFLGASLQVQAKHALPALQRAAELLPDDAEAHNNLGVALVNSGKIHDAIASFHRALEIQPDYAGAHNSLGAILAELGYLDDAVSSLRQALQIDPGFSQAHCNLGTALQALGHLDDAVASYGRALEINPGDADAHNNLGVVFKDMGRLHEAVASYQSALAIKPDYTEANSNLLFCKNYLSPDSFASSLADAQRFGDLVTRRARPYSEWQNIPDPDRCLRVGLVSGDLRIHTVARFVEGMLVTLSSLASGRLELIGYPTHYVTDALTDRIKACCHGWHSAVGLSDEQFAEKINDDGIDILIDLSGHTAHNRLPMFAWKPAPVQVSWLGYFATTGVKAIDYLIADPWTLPETEEANFTEKIWRLPETRLCLTPPEEDVRVAPLPALTNGYVTFGCFNNLTKMNDAVVALWARVLDTVRGSHLLIKAKQIGDDSARATILERFASRGIGADRLILEGLSPRLDYFAVYNRIDIALDPFPYPGGATTVESLWMGVPVLTLGGTSFLARQGVGFLMNAGLPDWIAADADDYLARAVAHAGDLPRLAALRKGLRQQVLTSPIFDAPRFAGHFEAALRGMWRTWCSTQHLPAHCQPLPQAEIDQLVGMFNAGRHAELEERTRFLIDQDPDLGIAWKFLGASLQVQAKHALPALQRAAELLPDDAEAHNNLGVALTDRGDLEAAVASFRRALGIDPDNVGAHKSLGAILKGLGRPDEAASSLCRALRINPDDANTHSYLGNVLTDLGQLDEAVASYRRALAIRPDFVEAHNNLGVALRSMGQFDEAVASYRRALEINPEFSSAHTNLGVSLVSLGRLDEAIASHRRAVELAPDVVKAHFNLGIALQARGHFDEALASLRQALQINPEAADAHLSLGDVLNELGQPGNALASYRRALEIKPDLLDAHSNLLFTHNYLSDQSAETMLAHARRYGEIARQQARPYSDWPNSPAHDRCLRVGLVSGDLRDHPVGHFIEGVLSALSSDSAGRLNLIAYSNNAVSDPLTERIKACCHAWRLVAGISDQSMARQIRADSIDILIDLAGHTGHNRLPLFAWKPAPVQVSWLGYFGTTGLTTMDYLIADPLTLPESEEVFFTEKIWRLPETRLCFTPPDMDIDVAPLPALNKGCITFGCFHNPNKINDTVVALWSRVLRAVPDSGLLLKGKPFGEPRVQQEFSDRFAARGIDAGRLAFEGASPRADYLASYQRVDIVLDSFPFPGGTTTAESLWMGVPVLTLAGSGFLERQGLGFLMNAGLPDWIAADADDYVARAVAHAGDLPRLAVLRSHLRQQVLNSPIFDAPCFAGNLEAALRGMWQSWCDSQSDAKTQNSEPKPMKTFLHVGCGSSRKNRTTRGFNVPDWNELRLDINPDVHPDIVGTMLDMSAVPDGSVDALYSAHNIEHLYAHEVPLALAEFRRVLKPDGFAVITCPDLQSVCQLIAEDKLLEPAYESPAGPISPLDILYGLRTSLEQGNLYMAHRCGFTEKVLVGSLREAGFGGAVSGSRAHPYYDLWVVATKSVQPEELMAALADAHFPA